MPGKIMTASAATMLLLATSGNLHAQETPDTENGRYTLAPVTEGFVRLDTRTGVVSTCRNDGGWICRVVPDERAALDSEMGKLQVENQKLKEQLAQRDGKVTGKTEAPLGKEDRKKSADAAPESKFDFQLPADHQKLMALLDRVWERLVEMANVIQKKLSDKI